MIFFSTLVYNLILFWFLLLIQMANPKNNDGKLNKELRKLKNTTPVDKNVRKNGARIYAGYQLSSFSFFDF